MWDNITVIDRQHTEKVVTVTRMFRHQGWNVSCIGNHPSILSPGMAFKILQYVYIPVLNLHSFLKRKGPNWPFFVFLGTFSLTETLRWPIKFHSNSYLSMEFHLMYICIMYLIKNYIRKVMCSKIYQSVEQSL